MLETLYLGQMSIVNDEEEFIEGMRCGMEDYFAQYVTKRQMSARDFHAILSRTLDEHHTPRPWQMGFLAGLVAALLHPDVSNLHIDQPYLEALSLKCEAVYQGRDTSPIGLFLRTGAQQVSLEHLHPSVSWK